VSARIDKDAIGVVVGFGPCIAIGAWLLAAAFVSWLVHQFGIYAPMVRDFILWIVEAPTFAVTVVLTVIVSAVLTWLLALAFGRIQP
jgi:hypothetical protein